MRRPVHAVHAMPYAGSLRANPSGKNPIQFPTTVTSSAPAMDFSKPYEPSADAKPIEQPDEPATRKRTHGAVPVLFRRKSS